MDPSRRKGAGHYDYFAMNLLLQKGALQLMIHLDEKPDIIHCHDGHTALIPAIINETGWLKGYFRSCGLLTTIHNAGRGYHQEVDDIPFARGHYGLAFACNSPGPSGGNVSIRWSLRPGMAW